MTLLTYLGQTLSSYFSSNMRAKEARRVYCCHMKKFLRTRNRAASSYGDKVILRVGLGQTRQLFIERVGSIKRYGQK